MLTWVRVLPLVLFLCLCATGCATSEWEKFYVPNGNPSVMFKPTESVQIRTVDAKDLADFFRQEAEIIKTGDTAVEDFTWEQRNVQVGRLLTFLKIKESPEHVVRLGQSLFHGPLLMDPRDRQLESFAKSIGADYVVYCHEYVGRENRVTYIPQYSFSQANATVNAYGPNGAWATGTAEGYGSAMTMQPMQVAVDVNNYLVMYFRKLRSGEDISSTFKQ